jgi:hypothetical protein
MFSMAIKCCNWHKIERVPCPVVEFAIRRKLKLLELKTPVYSGNRTARL